MSLLSFSDLLLGDGGHLDLALFLTSFLVFLHGLLAAVDATADAADDAGNDSEHDEGEDDDHDDHPGLHTVLNGVYEGIQGLALAGIVVADSVSIAAGLAFLVSNTGHSFSLVSEIN